MESHKNGTQTKTVRTHVRTPAYCNTVRLPVSRTPASPHAWRTTWRDPSLLRKQGHMIWIPARRSGIMVRSWCSA